MNEKDWERFENLLGLLPHGAALEALALMRKARDETDFWRTRSREAYQRLFGLYDVQHEPESGSLLDEVVHVVDPKQGRTARKPQRNYGNRMVEGDR